MDAVMAVPANSAAVAATVAVMTTAVERFLSMRILAPRG
jgi:hypothetical protein